MLIVMNVCTILSLFCNFSITQNKVKERLVPLLFGHVSFISNDIDMLKSQQLIAYSSFTIIKLISIHHGFINITLISLNKND